MFVRDSLKEEIFRLDNQTKPKPRKKRNIKVKSINKGIDSTITKKIWTAMIKAYIEYERKNFNN